MKALPALYGHTQAGVRDKAKEASVELAAYLGAGVVAGVLLDKMPAAMRKDVDAAIEQLPPGRKQPGRFTRKEAAERAAREGEGGAEEMEVDGEPGAAGGGGAAAPEEEQVRGACRVCTARTQHAACLFCLLKDSQQGRGGRQASKGMLPGISTLHVHPSLLPPTARRPLPAARPRRRGILTSTPPPWTCWARWARRS